MQQGSAPNGMSGFSIVKGCGAAVNTLRVRRTCTPLDVYKLLLAHSRIIQDILYCRQVWWSVPLLKHRPVCFAALFPTTACACTCYFDIPGEWYFSLHPKPSPVLFNISGTQCSSIFTIFHIFHHSFPGFQPCRSSRATSPVSPANLFGSLGAVRWNGHQIFRGEFIWINMDWLLWSTRNYY